MPVANHKTGRISGSHVQSLAPNSIIGGLRGEGRGQARGLFEESR
jgi:hypothetical protein